MKIRAWLAMTVVMAALCVAGCDENGQDSAASSTSIAVLGPTPLPSPEPLGMNVRRAFTAISNNSTYDIGARGWSVAGPLVDFQIDNPNRAQPIYLDNQPDIVVVSGFSNVGHVTVIQPTTNYLPGGNSTSFSLEFTVHEPGDFEFGVSISNHGPFSSDFFFVVSGKGQAQLAYTKTISSQGNLGVFINGAADGNPEKQHTHADNAKATVFSPNGRFGVANINNRAIVFSTATGNSVDVTNAGPYSPWTDYTPQFVWQNGANDTQYLAILPSVLVPAQRQIFTCVVGGNLSPQVSNLREVSLVDAPSYDFMLTNVAWSLDGGRLAFYLRKEAYDPGGTSEIRGCVFQSGIPGPAHVLATVAWNYEFTHFSWATAQAASDTLVYYVLDNDQRAVRSMAVTESNGRLFGGTPALVATGVTTVALSPNGNRLAFVALTYTGWLPYAYCFSTPTLAPVMIRNLPGAPGAIFYNPTWTADSKTVGIHASFHTQTNNDVYAMRLTTATGPVVLNGLTLSMTNSQLGVIGSFAFSPDGKRIAIECLRTVNSVTEQSLYLIAVESSPETVLVTRRNAILGHLIKGLSFSPRGDALAYSLPVLGTSTREISLAALSGPRFMVAAASFAASGNNIGAGVKTFRWLR